MNVLESDPLVTVGRDRTDPAATKTLGINTVYVSQNLSIPLFLIGFTGSGTTSPFGDTLHLFIWDVEGWRKRERKVKSPPRLPLSPCSPTGPFTSLSSTLIISEKGKASDVLTEQQKLTTLVVVTVCR